ncbi:MAG: hypothetical protein Q8K65_11340 [Alphaproteobacteria bacterium]|nr:hypothetical protein [Alphaproteobacteria bacterium]
MNQENLKAVVTDILKMMPHAPFLCLQMSSVLYAVLTDKHGIKCSLVTGDLSFGDTVIFKHDFSISGANNESLNLWSGHAWVELDGLIIDLSFFRTIYSNAFTKPCKTELISFFGEGRGCIIAAPEKMLENNLLYTPIEVLTDEDATGIIKGTPRLFQWIKG